MRHPAFVRSGRVSSPLPRSAPTFRSPTRPAPSLESDLWRGKNTTSRWASMHPPASQLPHLPAPFTIDYVTPHDQTPACFKLLDYSVRVRYPRAQEGYQETAPASDPNTGFCANFFPQKPGSSVQASLAGILSVWAGYCNNRRPAISPSESILKRIERNRTRIRNLNLCVHEE